MHPLHHFIGLFGLPSQVYDFYLKHVKKTQLSDIFHSAANFLCDCPAPSLWCPTMPGTSWRVLGIFLASAPNSTEKSLSQPGPGLAPNTGGQGGLWSKLKSWNPLLDICGQIQKDPRRLGSNLLLSCVVILFFPLRRNCLPIFNCGVFFWPW